ncbi:MAG: tRNA (adenosine(37)-N6)-threonylcarbamoyltransferase complex ATPase subunit type 1 TsaE [Desulfuromonadales bacterium]|nr:tRNA (adenosine(37)-N6)-threonylcarbamoyltransferase complex ATPase subunit type 1 TsaE [Desulfuromonadales bacterium]
MLDQITTTITTNNSSETQSIGAALAAFLTPGDFIALKGDLGAGKTEFAKGVARGLDVDPSILVTSPTYTLLNIYKGRIPMYHFDLYRLAGDNDVVDLGFNEYFSGDGVSIVEWSERLNAELPQNRVEITFLWQAENSRIVEFQPFGERFIEIVSRISS